MAAAMATLRSQGPSRGSRGSAERASEKLPTGCGITCLLDIETDITPAPAPSAITPAPAPAPAHALSGVMTPGPSGDKLSKNPKYSKDLRDWELSDEGSDGEGDRSVAVYAVEFRTLAAETGWNDDALSSAFWQGLSETLKDELAARDRPTNLEDLIALAIWVDQRLLERNFIDETFARQNNIPFVNKEMPVGLEAIDGRPLKPAFITLQTVPLLLQFVDVHTEIITLDVIHTPSAELILGLPWLQLHNPRIDWTDREPVQWAPSCAKTCTRVFQRIGGVSTISEKINSLPSVYWDFRDVFDKARSEVLPPHRPFDCPIDLLPGAPLPRGRSYPLSLPETKAMNTYIAENLERGFIRKSSSPVGAGFFFVKKKDGSLRPCIDYRGLNNITRKNRYPLPLIPELFDRLQGATIFSKLDLRGAYNLVRIREGDEWKTAFNTHDGHYEYLVMPFGLCNAPAVFQDFVNEIFRDILNTFLIVYLDDILIFSKTAQDHIKHVQQVLLRLRENHLFAKLEKCQFHLKSVAFLGYVISDSGFKMDPEKLKAILEWPLPTTLKAVQRFLGFANYYRRFIRNFSDTVSPITTLTKRGADPSSWSVTAKEAFESLKKAFVSAPILTHPDPGLPFTLEVDASDIGAGAVLSQRTSPLARLHPCAFFSKKFSSAEQNYDVGNRELLAIKLALEEWRHFLEGTETPITILTDHKNLLYLEGARRLNARQARWALFFSRFNFLISFIPGSKNLKADALSRQFLADDRSEEQLESIIPSSCILSANSFEVMSKIQSEQSQTPRGLKVPEGRLYTAPQHRKKVLEWCHSSKSAGHPGIRKTNDLVQRTFWWPERAKDVEEFVKACSICARNKVPRVRPAGLLLPLPIPDRPWSHISMDFIVELPESKGKNTILVVIDRFSKQTHLVPLRGLPNSPRLADVFIQEIFRLHGVPSTIVSDRGSQFVSKFWRAFSKRLGIALHFSSGYHPQTNGQTERVNQSLEQYLRCFITDTQEDWVDLLPWAEFVLNSLRNDSTQESPFFINYGFHPSRLPFSSLPSGVPAVDKHVSHLKVLWSKIQENLRVATGRQKLQADRLRRQVPEFVPGDTVWLSSRNIRLKVPTMKLAPKFLGPFPVVRRINPVAYELRLPPSMKISPVFHVSLLKPVFRSSRFSKKTSSPPPIMISGQQEYEVQFVLDSRKSRGGVQYLVHWRGFGPEERSWIPYRDLHAPQLLRAFHRRNPSKPYHGRPEVAPEGGGTVRIMETRHSRRWNDDALSSAFWQGLSETLKDELAARDRPTNLEDLIALAIWVDQRLLERNFIDETFARQNNIPFVNKEMPVGLEAIDGRPLKPAFITLQTVPLLLQFVDVHTEIITLDVIHTPSAELILGLPWLQLHNPRIDWTDREPVQWAPSCAKTCTRVFQRIGGVSTISEKINSLPSVYWDFRDVFDKARSEVLPPHRPFDCPIDLLPGAPLPRGRSYPLSLPETKAMNTYIAENLERGFIRKSSSPVGAGFFFVKKKDGSLRPCIDYRGLNNITRKNRYPLPLIPELFDRLQGATIFSKLDLRGAYNLVRIREGDEWKTAFNTHDGHYEYLVMPFGLCNAPAVFQDFVNEIFRDILNTFLIVYLDDILIFSKTAQDHIKHVQQVLLRLRENHLFAKLEKCQFHLKSVAFLGYVISDSGFKMDPEKLKAILEWPLPTTLKAVQRFLGFANYYRRFIRNFSDTVSPITTLTKRGADPSSWSVTAKEAFESLKKAFVSAPILTHPDPGLPFTLEVDASDIGAGAVLSQRTSPLARLHPCAFFSKKFSSAEQNYDVGNRELLAIKLALEEWRHFLEGTETPITILTDHKNLLYLEGARRLNARQARWALFFSRFNFLISFIPGSKNLKADALSRQFLADDRSEEQLESIIPSSCILSANSFEVMSKIQSEQSQTPRGLKVPEGRLYTAPQHRKKVLEWCHSSKSAGHPGIRKTNDLVQRTFWWPERAKDVEEFVKACSICARNKVPRVRPAGLLLPLPIPDRPWSHISMDFIVELPESKGKNTILVVIDRFSKQTHLVPLRGLPNSPRLADVFIQEIFRLHGVPSTIVSDRGSQFVSKFWRAFSKRLGIALHFSSGYHPQTNGQTERVNQSLEQYLRCFITDTQEDWVDLLPWAEFVLNSLRNDSTQESPFFINYGFHPSRLPFSSLPSGVPAVDKHVSHLKVLWSKIQENLRVATGRQKLQADRLRRQVPEFVPGDTVWLSSRNIRLKVPTMKLAPKFLGPFPVVRRINPVAYELRLPPSMKISPVFHVSLLKPVFRSSRFSKKTSSPPPIMISGQQEYEVQFVLDSRKSRGGVQYLVHWRGFGPEERSWIPYRDLHAPQLLRAFHRRNPSKPYHGRPEVAPEGGGTVRIMETRHSRQQAAVILKPRSWEYLKANLSEPAAIVLMMMNS
ncbi:uncharacterized protein LOC142490799 [Ascaphus truei]|uniref:uncharacterized protein LOC142490799 n=1 Tax=Ascaphus truei TaxID=8439 RepID=UPI003F5A7755